MEVLTHTAGADRLPGRPGGAVDERAWMIRLYAAAILALAVSPWASFALAGLLLVNVSGDTPSTPRRVLVALLLLSMSLMVGSRSLDPAQSNDIEVYYDIYRNLAAGDLDMLSVFGGGLELALPLLMWSWTVVLPPLTLKGLMFCLALTSGLLFAVWVEKTFASVRGVRLPALVGICLVMFNMYYATQLARQFLSLIVLLYAFSAPGRWRQLFYLLVASSFHLTALPFFGLYLLARRGWPGWLCIVGVALLLRLYFMPLLLAFVDLPEAVTDKLVYYADAEEGFTADDLVSMRMMLLLAGVSVIGVLGSGFRPDARSRQWLALPWLTMVVQLLLLPIPLASLRATLLVHSVVPGLIAFKMLSGRAHKLLLPVLNLLLLYKIAAFALADGGANFRPTFSMVGSFFL
jgi:hypothetical protein